MPSKKNLLFQLLNICLSGILAFLVLDLFVPILKEKTKTYIKFNVPSDDGEYPFNGHKIVDDLKSQFIIKTLSFTGNHEKDDQIQDQFATLLREESKKKRTLIIYRIYLPNTVKYGRLISLLNLMKEAGYKRYVEWENYFYVLTDNARTRH